MKYCLIQYRYIHIIFSELKHDTTELKQIELKVDLKLFNNQYQNK